MTRILDIPRVDHAAAHSAALRARQAGTAADACLDDLAAALAPAWSGVASQAYLDGRAMVSREATALTEACEALSRGILDFVDEVAAVLPGWRRDAARLAQLERGAADPTFIGVDPTDVVAVEATVAERDRLREAVAVWERRYDEAGMLLAGACARATALVDDGVLSTSEQLWAIPETLMRVLVVEPGEAALMLADDPSLIDDFAKASAYGLVDQVHHPVRTAEEMAGAEHYAEGEWGEGTGTLAASAVGFFGLRRLIMDLDAGRMVQPDGTDTWPPPAGTYPLKKNQRLATLAELVRFRRNIDVRDASSTPRSQTLDEMRADLDLSRSEHPAYGHTLSRHVDVTEQYLEFRLRHGTPENDGRVSSPVDLASRWTDREMARATIQEAIRTMSPEQIRAVSGPANGSVTLTATGPGLGEVWKLDPPGGAGTGQVVTAPATSAKITLAYEKGNLFIMTTRLEADPSAHWTER